MGRTYREEKIVRKRMLHNIAKRAHSSIAAGNWGKWEDRSSVLHLHPTQGERRPYKGVLNDFYSVQFVLHYTAWGAVHQLMVRRHDALPINDHWAVLQRIKCELMGVDRAAVEVYPTAEDKVDAANMYHLWVLPEGFKLPFSLKVEGNNQ